MVELSKLDPYSGDSEHVMTVDLDHYKNTGTPDVSDEDNLDDFVYNLNEWN